MILENVKAVKIAGMRLEVEYTDDVNKLQGDNLGNVTHTDAKIYIKKTMVPWMQSHTLWHEIGHSICYLFKIIEVENAPDIEFNEREVSRFATALNSLEIEYIEKPKETDYSHLVGECVKKEMHDNFGIRDKSLGAKWFYLKDVQPTDESQCMVIDFKYGVTRALWKKSQQRFIHKTGEHVDNPAILWAPFNQELWEKLLQVNNA